MRGLGAHRETALTRQMSTRKRDAHWRGIRVNYPRRPHGPGKCGESFQEKLTGEMTGDGNFSRNSRQHITQPGQGDDPPWTHQITRSGY